MTDPEAAPAVVGVNVTFNAALWLGVRTKPAFTPESLNPAPVTLTAEMVTFEFPVFFREMLCELLALIVTFPKARFEGLTLREAVAAAPVPVRATVVGEPGALLVRETAPEALPAELGSNAMLSDADWPGWIVSGVDNPDALKPAPVTV